MALNKNEPGSWVSTPGSYGLRLVALPGTEPNQLHSIVDWVITGGTGRFENATGTIQADAYVTMPGDPYALEWSVTWILDGTVNY